MKHFLIVLLSLVFSGNAMPPEICNNAIDDDGDNLIDFNDPDCPCEGPNLVPNPSFENYSSCPNDISGPNPGQDQYDKIDSWLNTYSPIGPKMTPDVYNSCSNGGNDVPWTNGVSLTNPLAADGEGYAGLVTYITGGDFREYITARLNTPLQAGKRYSVGFKWRIPTGDWVLYTNRFGIHFSNAVPNTYFPVFDSPSVLDVTPQIELPTTGFLDETSQWLTFTQDYIATGNENYITLGNFYKDISTTVHDKDALALGYVFVDDISVREVLSPESITVSPDVTINPGDNTVLNATASGGSPTYTWLATPADPSLAGQENSENPNVSPSENTTYSVTADFGNCTIKEQVVVTVNTPCPNLTATANPTTIVLNEGSVQLNTTPIANAYYHTWSGSASADLNGTTIADPIFTPTSAGTFTFTVETNFNGTCTNSAEVTVVVTELPTPGCGDNLVPNPSFENIDACPGFPGRLEPDAFYWESPTNAPADLFAQCATSASVGVPNNSRGSLQPSDGENYAGFIGYFSSINDYRQYLSIQLLEPLQAGEEYEISFNLALATNFSIAIDQLGIHLSSTELPPNFSINLLNATPQVVTPVGQALDSKSWQEINLSYTATGGEQYIYIGNFNSDANTNVTNAPGGSFNNMAYYYIDEVSIVGNVSSETVDAGTDVTINLGENTNLSASPSSGTPIITWTVNPADPSLLGQESNLNLNVSPTQTTTYTVTADYSGCATQDTVTVTVNNPACTDTIDAGMDVTIDQGETTILTVTPSGGTPNYTWTASPLDISLSGQENAQSPLVSPTETTSYMVTADFGGGCTATATVMVTVGACSLALDPISLSVGDADCGQTNGSITGLVVSGNSGSETYSWADAMGNIVGTSIDLMAVGLGNYTLTVTDGATCSISAIYTVNELGPAQLDATNLQLTDADCGQRNGGISGITYSETLTGTVFIWTNENGDTVGNALELNNITAGAYSINATDTAGCSVMAGPFLIQEAQGVSITGGSVSDAACGMPDGSVLGITLDNASGAQVYQWSDANGMVVGTGSELVNIGLGSYTLTVTDLGCSDTETFNVQEVGLPDLDTTNVTVTDADCSGANTGSVIGIQFVGNNTSATYSWTDASGAEISTQGLALANVGEGSYTLTVRDALGCGAVAGPYTVNRKLGPLLSGGFVTDPTCSGNDGRITNITSNDMGSMAYSWTNVLGTVVGTDLELTNMAAGSYTLTAGENGCSATIGPFALTSPQDCQGPKIDEELRVATIITPNADGDNDTFIIEGLENYPNSILYVYNRWGSKLYQARAYDNSWDGTFEGNPLPVGTYYYILELNDPGKKIMKGTITILR